MNEPKEVKFPAHPRWTDIKIPWESWESVVSDPLISPFLGLYPRSPVRKPLDDAGITELRKAFHDYKRRPVRPVMPSRVPRRRSSRSYVADSKPLSRWLPNPGERVTDAMARLREALADKQRDDSHWSWWVALCNYTKKLSPGARACDLDEKFTRLCLAELEKGSL